jgi:phosphoglycerate kinase
LTLKPVAKHLRTLLNRDVIFVAQNMGKTALAAIENRGDTRIVLIENLRFDRGEKKNTPFFSKALAELANGYVNDAFGVLHRKHASVYGTAAMFSKKAVGFLIQKEYDALQRLYDEKPMMAVLGGSKVSDKIVLMENLIEHCTDIFVGGAMAYTFLKAKGIEVGTSRVEEEKLKLARDLCRLAELKNVQIHLPTDHVTATEFSENAEVQVHSNIPQDQMGVDIGPETIQQFSTALGKAKSIFWNGPMGVFEWASCAEGTKSIGQALAESPGYAVVGGGDSAAATHRFGLSESINHVSTGGGASLAFLEGEVLPGVQIFMENK